MRHDRRFCQCVMRLIQKKSSQARLGALVAEYSAATRKSLSDPLAGLPPMEVPRMAKDGVEATDGVKSSDPDVLILDIHMPRCNRLKISSKLLAAANTVKGMAAKP
jgi:chemotaxis response regulator CheB